MKAKLWGGPHDGLEINVDKNAALLRMPVSGNIEVMTKPVDFMDATRPCPLIARYVRHGNTETFNYAGQEKM